MQSDVIERRDSLLRALGLCQRAGKLITGVPMICEALKAGKRVYAVIAPFDNAKNSSKRLQDRCTYYGVPLYTVAFDGEELAHAVGKHARLAAIAVTDEHLSRLVTASLLKTKEQ